MPFEHFVQESPLRTKEGQNLIGKMSELITKMISNIWINLKLTQHIYTPIKLKILKIYMNQNLAKDRYKKSIKVEQGLLEAIPEVFSVKIGKISSPIYKGKKWIHPRYWDHLTNSFRKYLGSTQREDITTVLFTFLADCLKSEVADLVRNTKIEWQTSPSLLYKTSLSILKIL